MIHFTLKSPLRTLTITSLFLILTGCANQQHIAKKNASQENKNLHLATQYLKINQSLKAITRLDKALVINPRSAQAYGLLGVIYQKQGEYTLADKNFRKALQLKPNDSNIRNNYGTLFYVTEQYKEAAKQFHHVTKDVYYESRDRVFENLGTTYLRMGKTEEAISYYQRALRLNTYLSGANLKLAEIYLRQNHLQQAHSYYIDFTATGSQTAESLWFGIRLAHRMNQPKQVTLYGKQLSQTYTHSTEYRQYQTLLNDESRNE